jgi:hypothetical protein
MESAVETTIDRASLRSEDGSTSLNEEEASPPTESFTDDIPDLLDEQELLCDRCVNLNLGSLVTQPPIVFGHDRNLMEVGTAEMLATSTCPLCQLATSVSPHQSELGSNVFLYLRAFFADVQFAGRGPNHPEFARSIC